MSWAFKISGFLKKKNWYFLYRQYMVNLLYPFYLQAAFARAKQTYNPQSTGVILCGQKAMAEVGICSTLICTLFSKSVLVVYIQRKLIFTTQSPGKVLLRKWTYICGVGELSYTSEFHKKVICFSRTTHYNYLHYRVNLRFVANQFMFYPSAQRLMCLLTLLDG